MDGWRVLFGLVWFVVCGGGGGRRVVARGGSNHSQVCAPKLFFVTLSVLSAKRPPLPLRAEPQNAPNPTNNPTRRQQPARQRKANTLATKPTPKPTPSLKHITLRK
jgi:hypothetical protein